MCIGMTNKLLVHSWNPYSPFFRDTLYIIATSHINNSGWDNILASSEPKGLSAICGPKLWCFWQQMLQNACVLCSYTRVSLSYFREGGEWRVIRCRQNSWSIMCLKGVYHAYKAWYKEYWRSFNTESTL